MALKTNLISHWKLNEASGNALDSHGANDLTDNNTVGTAAGKIGNSRDFEKGNVEYFNRADNTDFSLGSDTAFEMSCWINLESITLRDPIIAKGAVTSVGDEYLLWIGDGGGSQPRIQLHVGNGGSSQNVSANTFGALSTGTWYHIRAWHDPATDVIGVSVNNVEDTAAWSGGTQDTVRDFLIAATFAGDVFDGLIDEVSFWKGRVLTAGERSQIYNGGSGYDFDLWDVPASTAALGGGFPIRRTYRPRPFAPGFGR